MRLCQILVGTAFMSFALIVEAAPPVPYDELKLASIFETVSSSEPLKPPPSPLIAGDKIFGSAYNDTLKILSTANACSDFFGGPGSSVDIFNQLIGAVSKGHLSNSIGMRMTGRVTTIFNNTTKKHYRMFEKVSINTNGPFYKRRISNSEPSIPRIGIFEPNSREIRVLILLHELGHLVKGDDGKWLLPDDGKDEGLSKENSGKIEDVCGEQIKNVGKDEPPLQFAGEKKNNTKIALAYPTPVAQP
jgi:hypothetical protein